MSRTFSTNSGSLESLKVSCRCGCRPNARQMRETAVCDRRASRAIERVLQCVAPSGTLSRGLASSPLADRLLADSLARRHGLVFATRSAAQNNARTQRQRLRRLAPQRQCLELLSFGLAQHELRLGSSAHRSLAVCTRYTTDSDEAEQFNLFLTHYTSAAGLSSRSWPAMD